MNSGETLIEALRRELEEEIGIDDGPAGRGPGRARRLDRARSMAFVRKQSCTSSSRATSADGRSRPSKSRDAAVRGHRLFSFAELDDVTVHPPIQRFLRRWRPGDPAVYLGSMWAP